jgi:hypothetical protein
MRFSYPMIFRVDLFFGGHKKIKIEGGREGKGKSGTEAVF